MTPRIIRQQEGIVEVDEQDFKAKKCAKHENKPLRKQRDCQRSNPPSKQALDDLA